MPPIARLQSTKAEAEVNVGRQPVVDKESESELGLPPQKRRRLDKPDLRTIHKRIDRDRAKIGNISQQPSQQSSILMDQAGGFQQDSEVEILDAPGNYLGNKKNYVVKPQSRVGDGNCFFYAVFGTLFGSEYKTDKAQEMRMEWYEFLSQFKSLGDEDRPMPTSLKDNLKQLFQSFLSKPDALTNGKSKFRDLIVEKLVEAKLSEYGNLSNKELVEKLSPGQKNELLEGREFYQLYCDCIKKQEYHVFNDEIPILASLANTTIMLYDNDQYKDKPCVYRPIDEIVKSYKGKGSNLWGNKPEETIHHDGINHFSRGVLCRSIDEQLSSPLKDVFNSPTRRRNLIIPRSPDKENSPKKRKFSTISQISSISYKENSDGLDFGNISSIKPQYPVGQLSDIVSGVVSTNENSTLPGEPSELNLSKKNCRASGRSREREHYATGENDRLPRSREKRKLDSAIDEANQQSKSSNKKVQEITHKPYFVQTSRPLKNDGSFEDTKVNITPIKPDELSKKGRTLNRFEKKKSAKRRISFADENDSGLDSSLLSSNEILKSHEGLKKFLKECEKGGKIAIHCDYEDKGLSKVSLSCNKGRVYYIDEKFEQNALEEINELLSSGKVEKVIVYDIKEVKKTLSGIEKILDSVDDLKVMSYSLDTKKHDNSISSIVEHNFGRIEETFSAETLIKIHNKLESRLSEQEKLRKIYDNYDKPLTKVILNMEKKGIRVDVKRLEELHKTLDNKIKTLEKEIRKLEGIKFEIRSSKKLESILFNKMKLQHKTGLNNLSGTNSKVLRMLEREGVEITGKILRFRSLDKLKSDVKGFIDKVDEHDGRIHTDFLTTKTKTGRIVSKEPNLQNIPFGVEGASLIRQAFIAEEGHKLISVDYSQMELRILAEIANVKKFKEAFSKGEDIHAITAKQIFGRDDGEFRQKAKAINFGIIYGMSEYQLAKELEVSTQKAKTYIEKYYKEYPEIEEYKRNTVVYGRVNHYVETFSGRRINTEYINSRIIPVKEHYRRAAVNARIQGTGADMIRLAMIKLSKELKEKNLGEIINTIHDELIVEAEDGKAEEVQELMKEMMEKTVKEIIGVDIPVEINVGDDLNFGKELNEDQQETRDHLQENDDFTMSYDDSGYNSLLQEDEEETDDFINNYDLEGEEYRNSCFDILGIEYQVLVSMLCFHRAFNVHGEEYKNLSLATEEDQKKVGKFDDIVIRYTDKEDKKKAINVQVKRIDEEKGYNEINCTTLFPQGKRKNKDMFAINKYFMSFLEQDRERRDEVKYNVIFTNSNLATKDGKKVKYKLLEHSGIEVNEIRDEVLKDLLCANKEQPGFYNFSKREVREKVLKVIDPLQSESRKKVKRILEESTLSKVRIKEIEELLNSPSGKEIEKLIKEVIRLLSPLEKTTKENVLALLEPLFAAKKFTGEEYKKLTDDFFDKLVLAVNQPNRQELKMIVKKEIEEKIVKNNDSSKVFNDFEKEMFGWLENRIENEGIRITKENSGNYFREINKNADKGINTGTPREDERYEKTRWVGAMVPRIVYIWELLTFYIYKAFLANKNGKDYEELSIKIGEQRTGENNYTCFNYKDKCTCISFEYKDIREGSREEIFTSIDDHYDYFLKLSKESKNLEHFVVSVEGFELEKGRDFIGEHKLEEINFQEEKGDHKFLENFSLYEGKGEEESSFYRFTEETIRKLLDKTDEEHKKEKKAFLEILVFMVNLPGREKLESSIQSKIGGEENYYNLKELVLRWIESAIWLKKTRGL